MMLSTRRHPFITATPTGRTTHGGASDPLASAATVAAGEAPPTALERWAERFVARMVAWGDGATHRRMGSWTRR